MRFLLSSANVPLTIHTKATELIWSKGSCKYRHTYTVYIDMYKMTLTWMNEPREGIFHPLSTWPVLCNGGCLFRLQVGHIPVAYFFFSRHQYLVLFVLQNCSELAFVFGFSVKIGPTCFFAAFLQLSRAHLKPILFPWRYTRPFWLQTANQY